jgi:hypothetical protein
MTTVNVMLSDAFKKNLGRISSCCFGSKRQKVRNALYEKGMKRLQKEFDITVIVRKLRILEFLIKITLDKS